MHPGPFLELAIRGSSLLGSVEVIKLLSRDEVGHREFRRFRRNGIGQFLEPDVSESGNTPFAMILKSDETTFATHFGVAIGDRGKDDAVDLLYKRVAPGNNLHGVPGMVIATHLDLVGVLELFHAFLTAG